MEDQIQLAQDLAYMAGFFDGEGSVGIILSQRTNHEEFDKRFSGGK